MQEWTTTTRAPAWSGSWGELRGPTLIVASRDDPLVPIAGFEGANRPDPGSAVRLLVTEKGGHVAFIGQRIARGPDWTDLDRQWAENRIVQFAVGQRPR